SNDGLSLDDPSGGGGSGTSVNTVTISGNTTLDPTTAGKYLCNVSGGGLTATLPDPAGDDTLEFFIKNISFGSGNSVTVASVVDIEGSSSDDSLSAGEGRTYITDGNDWFVKS